MANKKGFTIFDFSLVIFVVILGFVIFFYINDYKTTEFEKITQDLIVTENAISKYNPSGIGFAELNSTGLKTTLQNTLQNPKAIDPIKKIEIYNNEIKIFEDSNIDVDCEKQIKLSRLVLYEENIRKAVFTFCE
jgi:hypothetical protein